MSGWNMRRRLGDWAVGSVERLRSTAWSIAQCSVAAMIAWWFATAVLDHPTPFFAPVAALVCLGLANSQRLRRIVELAVGVTIGVGVGDLLVSRIGSGWWQIALVVALSLTVAQLAGGGPLVTAQAGIQGTFLVALPQTPAGGLYRWEDALIGGACALLVAAVLPGDPSRAVRPQAQLLIREVAAVAREAAEALRSGRADRADATLDRARSTQVDVERWTEALRGAEEISRISPLRRHHRDDLTRYRRALVGVDRAARNLRVAVRRIAAVLDRGDTFPPTLADILQDLAGALVELEREVGPAQDRGRAQAALTALAARLDPRDLGAKTMSENTVVAQVRSAVVDLLEVTGTELATARALLPRRPQP